MPPGLASLLPQAREGRGEELRQSVASASRVKRIRIGTWRNGCRPNSRQKRESKHRDVIVIYSKNETASDGGDARRMRLPSRLKWPHEMQKPRRLDRHRQHTTVRCGGSKRSRLRWKKACAVTLLAGPAHRSVSVGTRLSSGLPVVVLPLYL